MKNDSPSLASRVILEEKVPFSQSILWKYQEDYFKGKGIQAWSGEVPYYVTSNLVIAAGYAQVIFRFIQEGLSRGSFVANEPIYIIETGSGSGKLSFHILSELLSLFEQFHLDPSPLCYVMTDFTSSNLDFWSKQPQLKPFVEQGILDFSLYDLNQKQDLHLHHKKTVLSAGSCKNPIIAIANYVFDTIPHDLFQVQGGKLKKGLCEVSTSSSNVVDGKVRDLNQLEVDFSFEEIAKEEVEHPHLSGLLDQYTQKLSDSSFLIPMGGIHCIDHLRSLSNGKLLMLLGDKGHYDLEALEGLMKPHIAFHGSFSMMVNFHAVSEYIQALGGHTCAPSSRQGLKVFLLHTGNPLSEIPETVYAYQEKLSLFSTGDFLVLKNNIIKKTGDIDERDFIATMRLSRWDPTIMQSLIDRAMKQLEVTSEPYKQELHEGLYQIEKNIYEMPTRYNFYLGLGQLFYVVGNMRKAIECFEKSIQVFGPSSQVDYYLGVSSYYLKNYPQALHFLKKAAKANAGSPIIQKWISRVEQERLRHLRR